jgi:hypothetical protein
VEDAQADAVLQGVAEQLARRGVHGLHERRGDSDADLQRKQRRKGAIRVFGIGKSSGDCAGDFVEEQFSNPQRRSRHEREQDAERHNQREQTWARGPHEARGRQQVGHHLSRAHAQRNDRFGLWRTRRGVISWWHLPQSY